MPDPDPTEVEEYRSLWTTEIGDYALVLDDDSPEPQIVNINCEYPEAKVFTDDDLAAAVTRRMQEAGAPVVTWKEMTKAHTRRRGGQ